MFLIGVSFHLILKTRVVECCTEILKRRPSAVIGATPPVFAIFPFARNFPPNQHFHGPSDDIFSISKAPESCSEVDDMAPLACEDRWPSPTFPMIFLLDILYRGLCMRLLLCWWRGQYPPLGRRQIYIYICVHLLINIWLESFPDAWALWDRLFDQLMSLPPVGFDAPCGMSDVTCEDFECPDNYSLIDDYLTTVCMDSGCTKHLCCMKDGEPWAVINAVLAFYRVHSCS